MDIPDVEIVVIYGVPDTMSQLYQVYHCSGLNLCVTLLRFSCVVEQVVQGANQELTYY